jgi:hypothetical protein
VTGKLLGIVLFVLAVWAGLEIYTNGTDGAFGGLFAGFGQHTEQGGDQASAAKRIGAKVQSELTDAAERRMGDEEDND